MDTWPRGHDGRNHCHITEYRKKDGGKKKKKDIPRELWDNIKHTNIDIIGIPEGKERKDLRKYLER